MINLRDFALIQLVLIDAGTFADLAIRRLLPRRGSNAELGERNLIRLRDRVHVLEVSDVSIVYLRRYNRKHHALTPGIFLRHRCATYGNADF